MLSLHVVISIVCRFPNVGVVLPSRWGSRLLLDACVDEHLRTYGSRFTGTYVLHRKILAISINVHIGLKIDIYVPYFGYFYKYRCARAPRISGARVPYSN